MTMANKPTKLTPVQTTVAEAAALDFTPWTHDKDEWTPPTDEDWWKAGATVLPPVRMAWMTMFKTPAEIEEILDGLDEDVGKAFLDGISNTVAYFRNFHNVMAAAEARLFCVASKIILKEDADV